MKIFYINKVQHSLRKKSQSEEELFKQDLLNILFLRQMQWRLFHEWHPGRDPHGAIPFSCPLYGL